MPEKHFSLFFETANKLNCVIGVREPNPLVNRWYRDSNYRPKPRLCKAKTAALDVTERNTGITRVVAGLVVSPVILPKAFSPDKLAIAEACWDEFLAIRPKKVDSDSAASRADGYAIIMDGPNKGLVTLHGKFIHSDYDLMFVNKWEKNRGAFYTSIKDRISLAVKVQEYFNPRGGNMIQHGSVFGWKGGLGANDTEYVFLFYPDGSFEVTRSSMMPTAEDGTPFKSH